MENESFEIFWFFNLFFSTSRWFRKFSLKSNKKVAK